MSNDPDNNPDLIAVAEKPLSVLVTGPNYADAGETQTFGSIAQNEEGTVNYQWYYRISPSDSWRIANGETGPSYTRLFQNPGGNYDNQAVRVIAHSTGETASDIQSVEVIVCEDGKHSVKPLAPCRN